MRLNNKVKTIILIVAILAVSQIIYLFPNYSTELNDTQNQATPENNTSESVQGAATESNLQQFDIESLYLLINAHRKDNNLSTLLIDPRLETSARSKIADMLEQNYFRHQDTAEQESWYLINSAGYDYKKAGENISFSHNTAWQVFNGWVNSPTHNKQLLSKNYEDMGLAADCTSLNEDGSPTCIVVLHLGIR